MECGGWDWEILCVSALYSVRASVCAGWGWHSWGCVGSVEGLKISSSPVEETLLNLSPHSTGQITYDLSVPAKAGQL